MRTLCLLTAVILALGCALPLVPTADLPVTEAADVARSRLKPDLFAGVDEVVTRGETQSYEYPKNLYETPSEEAKRRRGRWMAEWEGALFYDAESADVFCTNGVDDALWRYVTLGKTYYDWNACFDVTIRAAVADYPAPFICGSAWLIVREVLDAKECSCAERDGLLCGEWLP